MTYGDEEVGERMESTVKWLVCTGPGEFLFVAAALIAAGCEGGVEWEPDPARAYARAARWVPAVTVNAVVGACEGTSAPDEVACTLAGIANGTTVLCTSDARAAAPRVMARGVAAAVEPDALPRLLANLTGRARQGSAAAASRSPDAADEAASDARGHACRIPSRSPDAAEERADGEPAAERVLQDAGQTAPVPALPVADDLEEPDGFVAPPVPAPPRQAPAPPAVDGGASAPSLRSLGRLPRTGVSEHPRTAQPLAASGGPAVGPASASVPAQPASAADGERAAPAAGAEGVPGTGAQGPRAVGGVATEPVVRRPVVCLPQLECAVAGEDGHVPTLCFASPRGGVGKTALAVLTALSLAREGLAVALVDLDFQFGTCLGYLGADETDGLMDVGTPPERVRVDARTLARCRTTPERCLAAYEFCRAPEQAEVLSGMAGRLLRAARAGADVAVVDLPTGVNEVVAQVLDVADRCLLVSDQRAFSLESLASLQSLCARMGVARTKLVTVMNRCDPRHRDEGFLSRVQFEAQTPQIARVVDGGAEVMQMLSIGSAGELLAMRNRFALSTSDLARTLCADLGCQPDAFAARAPQPAPMAAPAGAGAPAREGVFRKHRKEKRGEQVPCPF